MEEIPFSWSDVESPVEKEDAEWKAALRLNPFEEVGRFYTSGIELILQERPSLLSKIIRPTKEQFVRAALRYRAVQPGKRVELVNEVIHHPIHRPIHHVMGMVRVVDPTMWFVIDVMYFPETEDNPFPLY